MASAKRTVFELKSIAQRYHHYALNTINYKLILFHVMLFHIQKPAITGATITASRTVGIAEMLNHTATADMPALDVVGTFVKIPRQMGIFPHYRVPTSPALFPGILFFYRPHSLIQHGGVKPRAIIPLDNSEQIIIPRTSQGPPIVHCVHHWVAVLFGDVFYVSTFLLRAPFLVAFALFSHKVLLPM